jgi:hypothetical protein
LRLRKRKRLRKQAISGARGDQKTTLREEKSTKIDINRRYKRSKNDRQQYIE